MLRRGWDLFCFEYAWLCWLVFVQVAPGRIRARQKGSEKTCHMDRLSLMSVYGCELLTVLTFRSEKLSTRFLNKVRFGWTFLSALFVLSLHFFHHPHFANIKLRRAWSLLASWGAVYDCRLHVLLFSSSRGLSPPRHLSIMTTIVFPLWAVRRHRFC